MTEEELENSTHLQREHYERLYHHFIDFTLRHVKPRTAVTLWMLLLRDANWQGFGSLHLYLLAKELRCTSATVRRTLKALEKLGLVQVIKLRRGLPSRYRLRAAAFPVAPALLRFGAAPPSTLGPDKGQLPQQTSPRQEIFGQGQQIVIARLQLVRSPA
jgi:hypothetical protein